MKTHLRGSLIILFFSFLKLTPAMGKIVEFDRLESYSIVSQNAWEIVFDITYFYDQAPQKRPAFLGVEGFEGTTACSYLTCEPVRLRRGRHTARVSLAVNAQLDRRRDTHLVNFFLYHAGQPAFASREVTLSHRWQRRNRPAEPVVEYQEYAVCFPDIAITVMRHDGQVTISSGSAILTDGREWECQSVQPGIFSLKRKSWKKTKWTVDTYKGKVMGTQRRYRGFLLAGETLPFRVVNYRDRCVIHLGAGRLIHDLKKDQLKLEAGGKIISNCVQWSTHCVKPDLYHLQHQGWKQSYWAADLTQKKSYTSRGGRFREAGGRFSNLPYSLEVK